MLEARDNGFGLYNFLQMFMCVNPNPVNNEIWYYYAPSKVLASNEQVLSINAIKDGTANFKELNLNQLTPSNLMFDKYNLVRPAFYADQAPKRRIMTYLKKYWNGVMTQSRDDVQNFIFELGELERKLFIMNPHWWAPDKAPSRNEIQIQVNGFNMVDPASTAK